MQRLWVAGAALWIGLGWNAGAQDRDRSATGAVLHGEYSAARAMELVYGDYDADSKSSLWTPKQDDKFNKRWPDMVRVQVLADDTYTDNGVPRHVLVTWAKPEETGAQEYSCHACGVLMGVSVFRREAAGWKVEASDLQLAEIGEWGRPDKAKVQRLGEHTYGVAVQALDMHQGEAEAAVWIFGPQKAGFGQWFKAELVDEDKYGEFPQDDWCKSRAGELDVMCVWREIDFAMQPAAGKEIYDLVRTERRPAGKVARSTLRFNGTEFVAAGR